MIIPDKLSVGGHVYKVIKDYKFKEDRGLWGQADHTLLEIRLADVGDMGTPVAQSKREEVFLHEILHCVCNTVVAKLEEDVLHRLSEGLYQMLKTNSLLKE